MQNNPTESSKQINIDEPEELILSNEKITSFI